MENKTGMMKVSSGKFWNEKPGPIYVRYYSKEHVAVEKEMSSHQDVTLDELIGIHFQI